MAAYYNDIDDGVCLWLLALIKEGIIPDGEIDNRSILDVSPDDVRGFTQCHFFAGIGGWAYALRIAGWPEDRPVWTGSPPCQPFSAAGRQLGRDDPRHLAPHFISLVGAARPPVLFGEQVASAEVFGRTAKPPKRGAGADVATPIWCWLDDLSDRLEAAHYAVGASDIPSALVGAPHIRQRTFFGAVRLGNAESGWERHGVTSDGRCGRDEGSDQAASVAGRLANMHSNGCDQGRASITATWNDGAVGNGSFGGLDNTIGAGLERQPGHGDDSDRPRWIGADTAGSTSEADAVSGLGGDRWASPFDNPWQDADWLFCRDERWRPVEPGTFPLAHGIPARVVRLRGYGNAVNPWAAKAFIETFDKARVMPAATNETNEVK